jgi:hypothetical protein
MDTAPYKKPKSQCHLRGDAVTVSDSTVASGTFQPLPLSPPDRRDTHMAATGQEDSSSNRVSDRKQGISSAASVSQESLTDSEGYGSSTEHVFADPAVASHWRNIFEKAGYENRHRFDPSFT